MFETLNNGLLFRTWLEWWTELKIIQMTFNWQTMEYFPSFFFFFFLLLSIIWIQDQSVIWILRDHSLMTSEGVRKSQILCDVIYEWPLTVYRQLSVPSPIPSMVHNHSFRNHSGSPSIPRINQIYGTSHGYYSHQFLQYFIL